MILQQFERQKFMQSCWQKQPFVIRHQGPDFIDPIDADTLAGLACETFVESRLIETGAEGSLSLRHGPFISGDFTRPPAGPWTLLVQAVDLYWQAVADLRSSFDFVPGWRIDDIMVSFATHGGGVGAHFDQYDVFLLQGTGSRRWQLGQSCDSATPLLPHDELRLLRDFNINQEVTLHSGDILYLPPRVAHRGISVGDSLCYSIGFRAPSLTEMLQGFSDSLCEDLTADQRYTDEPGTGPLPDNGLTVREVGHAFKRLQALFNNPDAFVQWFGRFASTPKYPEFMDVPSSTMTAETLLNQVRKQSQDINFVKNPASRFLYLEDTESQRLWLFVDGESYRCPIETLSRVMQLCSSRSDAALGCQPWAQQPELRDILVSMLNQGSVTLSTADENT